MIYLDYSATTPINKEVLECFNKTNLDYIGNPNSLHKLGLEANKLIEASTERIADILGVKPKEIIYTSGSSEANNAALKGIYEKYQNIGKHIITTRFEHPSIYGPISYLEKHGCDIDFVKTDENGIIDIENLKSLIREDTILVTIASVNSEIGLKQPIEEIGLLLKKYPNCFFHVDITQSVSKEKISLENIDLASFSAHKFFGIKGVGALIKKENVELEPLIAGGKSTSIYRSGTPMTALIVSMAEALSLANENLQENYTKVKDLNNYLKSKLSKYKNVKINSNDYSIPHILNISVLGIKPENLQHALEEYDIYISTQTACHTGSDISLSVMTLTNDEARAASSIRISLSYVTTMDEIDKFIEAFEICYKKLADMGC